MRGMQGGSVVSYCSDCGENLEGWGGAPDVEHDKPSDCILRLRGRIDDLEELLRDGIETRLSSLEFDRDEARHTED